MMRPRQFDIAQVIKDVWSLPVHRPRLMIALTLFGYLIPQLFSAALLGALPAGTSADTFRLVQFVTGLIATIAGLLTARYAALSLAPRRSGPVSIYSAEFLVMAWPLLALQMIGGGGWILVLAVLIASLLAVITVPIICYEHDSGIPAVVESAKRVWRFKGAVLICLFSAIIPYALLFGFTMNLGAVSGAPDWIAPYLFIAVSSAISVMLSAIFPVRIYEEIRSLSW